MNILVDVLIIVVSLSLLILGAEWLLQGAVIFARKKKISDLAIASTLIAFGTGLPTIAVNIAMMCFSSNGADVVVGNALGTNFVNVGLGLGISALIVAINTKYQVFEKELTIFLALSAVLTGFVFDGTLGRIEGLFLLLVYIITLYILYQYAKREKLVDDDMNQVELNTSTISSTATEEINLWTVYARVFVGMIFLVGFSILLAFMTERFSRDFGISEYVLGLTIIGIGTSLPMIVTSVRSAFKGYTDIILGNIFGSTIANIGLGLGIPALIAPLMFTKGATDDLYLFNLLNIVVIFSILTEGKILGKNKILTKPVGFFILICYLVYLYFKLF